MFDQVVLVIIGFFTMIALFRGFVRELLGILGLVASVMATYYLTPYGTMLLSQKIPSFFVSQFVSGSLILAFSLILSGIVNGFLGDALHGIRHGFADTVLGGLLGFAKGCIVAFLLYTAVIFASPIMNPSMDLDDEYSEAAVPTWLASSRTYPIFLQTHKYLNTHVTVDQNYGLRMGSMMYAKAQDKAEEAAGALIIQPLMIPLVLTRPPVLV